MKEPSTSNDTIVDKIRSLCKEHGISLFQLEKELNFGNGSISKWGKDYTPASDRIKAVAEYFNVSSDYLLGLSSVPDNMESLIHNIDGDEQYSQIQRAYLKLSDKSRDRMYSLLSIAFEDAFHEGNDE